MSDTAENTELLGFATYTAPKKSYDPPMNAFATYTAPKKSYDPPMYVFVTYADNVTPDPEPPTGGDMKYINLTNLYRFLTNLKNKFVKKSELQEELNSVIASWDKLSVSLGMTGWSDNKYTVKSGRIKNTIIIVKPQGTATDAQYTAFVNADIKAGDITEGTSLVLTVNGTIPTISIPVDIYIYKGA